MICLMGLRDAGIVIGTHDGDYTKLRKVRMVQKDENTIRMAIPLEGTVADTAVMCFNPDNILYTVDIDSYSPVFALYMAAV